MESISRRQFVFLGTAAGFAALGLTACGGGSKASGGAAAGTYKDGTYTGESSVLEAHVDGDGYGIITVTVENGAITAATFEAFQPDGTPKDSNYGKDGANYAVAQKIVSAGDDYAAALVEAGSVDGVDAISGATYLYDQFSEAAEKALAQAKE